MGTNRKLMSAAGLVVGLAATFSLVVPTSAVADDSPWDRGGRGPGADSGTYLLADGDDGCHSGEGGGAGTDDSPWD